MHEFQSAIHFNHVRRNIKDEVMAPDDVKVEVLNDIFGRKLGSIQLTDSSDTVSFGEIS